MTTPVLAPTTCSTLVQICRLGPTPLWRTLPEALVQALWSALCAICAQEGAPLPDLPEAPCDEPTLIGCLEGGPYLFALVEEPDLGPQLYVQADTPAARARAVARIAAVVRRHGCWLRCSQQRRVKTRGN